MCAPVTGQQAERYVRPLAISTRYACIRLRTESMTGTGNVLSLAPRFKAPGVKPDLPMRVPGQAGRASSQGEARAMFPDANFNLFNAHGLDCGA
jgi:hypothetical protein